jgi:hypothetical protein
MGTDRIAFTLSFTWILLDFITSVRLQDQMFQDVMGHASVLVLQITDAIKQNI